MRCVHPQKKVFKNKISSLLFKEAQRYLVGGVNSPVRAFRAVGGSPLFIKSAKGSIIVDEDGNRFIDYVMSWGALMLGHAHPKVVGAIKQAADKGTSFGAPTRAETELAKIISYAIPSIEKIRFVSSGTEATMSAIRLARGFTKRKKIIKFEGCYHGHCDSLLVKAGSGISTFSCPDSLGVTQATIKDTIVVPYNDIKTTKQIVQRNFRDIAAIIVEPVAANMGVVMPQIGFLAELRNICNRYGIILIFDEVITGFRFTFGGAQNLFGIEPDITCLGKIIGGGLPLAAYGGRKQIMEYLCPVGGVYQAGTLSGNPIAVNAGIATLKVLATMDYLWLNRKISDFCQSLKILIRSSKINCTVNHAGSIFTLFFTEKPVTNYAQAKHTDIQKFKKFFWAMLNSGIYCAPSQFEANFFSFAHTDKDREKTFQAIIKALKSL
ncbi:MAG: glutamate-1-semialdehyde 2,1-aminomutase [Candidatus Omnitrophica bacterium]|nr:glutamate-1-semialdehyde 2,1-aminomutase [Candidatus Omnitrophota bacterium]